MALSNYFVLVLLVCFLRMVLTTDRVLVVLRVIRVPMTK